MKQVWIPVDPIGKPRMTQRDRWKQRPVVLKYHSFCDILRLYSAPFQKTESLTMIFEVPMPKTWSKKKKIQMEGKPHQSKPDIDNLVKAVLDAFFEEDKQIYRIKAAKFWKVKGSILIKEDYAWNEE